VTISSGNGNPLMELPSKPPARSLKNALEIFRYAQLLSNGLTNGAPGAVRSTKNCAPAPPLGYPQGIAAQIQMRSLYR
jgi:hypothetical protein